MAQFNQGNQGNNGGGSGNVSTTEFTTNGSGNQTVPELIGKSILILYLHQDDGANTIVAAEDFSFNSSTGAFSGLDANTEYKALWTS